MDEKLSCAKLFVHNAFTILVRVHHPSNSQLYVKEKGKSSTDKIEGLACIITFLGITLNTLRMELWLTEEKIQRLKSLIEEWSSKRWCKKRGLRVPNWSSSYITQALL